MTVLHIRNFDDDLHYELKVEAARDRTSLREVVEDAVRRELDLRRRERGKKQARGHQDPTL